MVNPALFNRTVIEKDFVNKYIKIPNTKNKFINKKFKVNKPIKKFIIASIVVNK